MASCSGHCGGCSGCARELTLSEAEINFLRRLGEVAFLPVARQLGDLTPIYPETDAAENMSLILELLEKKGLISLDYDQPLAGFAGYGDYPFAQRKLPGTAGAAAAVTAARSHRYSSSI